MRRPPTLPRVPWLAVLLVALAIACAPEPPADGTASPGVDPAPEPPATASALSGAADAARRSGDRTKFRDRAVEAIALAPRHPELHYDLARAHALLGEHDAAARVLADAAALGAGWQAVDEPDFASFWADPGRAALRERLVEASRPAGAARIAARVPIELAPYPEGVTHDPTSGDLFLGSTYGRTIVRVDPGGERAATAFVADRPDLGGVLGLAVDAERGRLCAAHAFAPGIHDAAGSPIGRTGVACFDLASGEDRSNVLVPEDDERHLLNALAIDRDGTLYATDSLADRIWRLRDGGFEPVVARRPELSYPNGLALDPERRRLVVGHVEGASLVDLDTGSIEPIDDAGLATLAGIDGLTYAGDGWWISVQPSARRVARWRLLASDDNISAPRLDRFEVLLAHHPTLQLPTTGVIAGDIYYQLANSQLRVREPNGSIPWDRLADPVLLAVDWRP